MISLQVSSMAALKYSSPGMTIDFGDFLHPAAIEASYAQSDVTKLPSYIGSEAARHLRRKGTENWNECGS